MTLFYVCLIISVLGLLSGFIFSIKKECRKNIKTVVLVNTVGIGFSVFVLRYGVLSGLSEKSAGVFDKYFVTIGKAIIHTFQTFSLDEDYESFLLDTCVPIAEWGRASVWTTLYSAYATFLNVVAPVITVAIVAVLLEELISRLRVSGHSQAEKYVFSEINDATVTLAEDIREKKQNSFLIFTDAYANDSDEHMSELKDRIRTINGVCIKDDITTLKFRHSSYKPITFVLADTERADNIRVAAWLAAETSNVNKLNYVDVIVMTDGTKDNETLQAIIDMRVNKNMRFFAVNEYSNAICNLLISNPLYLRMDRTKKNRTCRVLILGCGMIGYEFLKSVIWCGQMPDAALDIVVISDNAGDKKNELKQDCPELFSTGIYNIEFVEKNIHSADFSQYVNENLSDVNYVFIALGNQKENTIAANNCKRIYDRIHLVGGTAPQICYNISDDYIFSAVNTRKEVSNNECLTVPFGNNKELYSLNGIFGSFIEKAALSVHLTYYRLPLELSEEELKSVSKHFRMGEKISICGKKDSFSVSRRYEYELMQTCMSDAAIRFNEICFKHKRTPFPEELRKKFSEREQAINAYYSSLYGQSSSRSSAIHLCYNMIVAGIYPISCNISESDIDTYNAFISKSENRVRIAKVEHLRWDAHMRSVGYVQPTQEEFEEYAYRNGNNHQNKNLKLHPCLVNWDDDKGIVLCDRDFELYNRDVGFMNGRYIHELDELDRVSLRVAYLNKMRTGKVKNNDYKKDDEVIIRATTDIIENASRSGRIV